MEKKDLEKELDNVNKAFDKLKSKNKVLISVNLNPNQISQIDAICSMQNRRKTEVIRELVGVGLLRYFDDPYQLF